ncbi:hypothetical protein CH333_03795 [candidate division WOR-3 bacterium JGI_Cruoil_03_44_89]|uniref:Glycine zipper family protein n=1 Tax=candidate division WOR-3 bacterium JGI_Cruoil_03_44_89 TaxID=1973748 RepID=A0A235BXK1_UNCW3|nr:MAG: hypothetical protein CH333_03795 [candidate division WOR-3 bacterium JGI_Cruoil_03_44_89]
MFRRFAIFLGVAIIACAFDLNARARDAIWTGTYRGICSDYGFSFRQTPDGGYIVVGYASGENNGQRELKPHLNAGRIAGEILAGALGGAGLGLVGLHGNIYTGDEIPSLGFMGMVVTASVGYIFGSAIGVYLVGNIGDETGSPGATLGGSSLGLAAGMLGYWVIGPVIDGERDFLDFAVFLIGSPIGATIGFNMTRRYKTPPTPETGLINFRDGEMCIALPTIYFRRHPLNERTIIQNVELVKVEF